MTTTQVNGKREIRTPLPQRTLNRSSPKFAWVITSGTHTSVQNFITVRLPLSPPSRYAKMCIKWLGCFLVLPSAYSQDPCTDFRNQYIKWRPFAQGCAFWGSRKQNFTFRPHFSPKRICTVHGTTMTIKGSLQVSIAIKAFLADFWSENWLANFWRDTSKRP